MKIKVVRYRRLISHDRGYGHDAVEAEAQVDDGEEAEAAFDALKAWVHERLAKEEERSKLIYDLAQLRRDVEYAARDRDRLKRETEDFRKIARGNSDLHNLAIKAGRNDLALLLGDSEIPF